MLRQCYQSVILAPFLTLTVVVLGATSVAAQTGKVLIADIRTDTADASMRVGKIEAGFALACELTGQFTAIPGAVRDSFLLAVQNNPALVRKYSMSMRSDSLTVADVAHGLDATGIAYLFSARIGNLVRSDLLLAVGTKYDMKATGIGYAAIRYADPKQRIADPAILASQQRALCVALRDTALYASADSTLNVRPAVPVVVGGMEFIENSTLIPWTLIREKITASYDAALIAVEALQQNPRIVAVDLETRDSIYGMAKMYLTENYNPVSKTELGTLRAFDLRHIVTGKIVRVQGGADLTMSMNWINDDGTMTPLSQTKRTLTVDSKQMMRDMITDAVKELGAGPLAPQ